MKLSAGWVYFVKIAVDLREQRLRKPSHILDYVFSVANRRKIYYLWRPFLSDPKDDMVLELAVSAGSEIIVTYNKDDFKGVEQFGIRVLTALEFLREIGELP